MAIWVSSYWTLLTLILSKWVCIGRHSEEDTVSSWASICFSWLIPCFVTAGAICEEDTATVTISKMLHPDHYQQKFWQLKYNRTTWRWGNKSYKQAEVRWFVFLQSSNCWEWNCILHLFVRLKAVWRRKNEGVSRLLCNIVLQVATTPRVLWLGMIAVKLEGAKMCD